MLDFESNMYPCLLIIAGIPDGKNEKMNGALA